MKKLISLVIGLALMLNSTLMVNAMAVGEASPTPPSVAFKIPAINYPLNNATLKNYPREAYLEWTKVTGATDYDVEIACDVCSTDPEKWAQVNTYIAYDNYFVTQPLAGDNQFRFRVRAHGGGQFGPWSDYGYFYYNTGSYLKVDGVDDTYNLYGNAQNIYYLDVLSNDEYTKTMGISELKIKTAPLYGTAKVENNKITYIPNSGFDGYDDLGYEVKFYDDSSKSYYMTSAWVTINIKGATTGGTLKAGEDTFDFTRQTADDNSKFILDVLDNDTIPSATVSSTVLSVSVTPLHGKAYADGDDIIYTPDKGFTGFDDLKYKISSGTTSSEAWVNINIKSSTPYTYKEEVKCVFQGATKEEKCYLAGGQGESDPVNFSCKGKETCVISVKGTEYQKEYTWKSSCGGYAYTYLDGVNDYAYFTCGTVTSPVTAKADNYTFTIANPNTTNSFLLDVLSNDTYKDFNKINLGVTLTALHGTATVDSSKKIKYVPYAGYVGYDDFEYQISTSDGLYTSKGWVTVTTNSPNYKAPVANADNYTFTIANPNTTNSFLLNVLSNDSYSDINKIQVNISLNALHGNLTVDSKKQIKYVPNTGYVGYDDFEYQIVTLDGLNSSSALVTINTTSPSYKAVVANPDNITAAKDKETVINVLSNDSYSGKVNLIVPVPPLHGTTYVNSSQQIVYKPTAGYTGYDDFEYQIADSQNGSNNAYAWVYVDVKASTKTPPAGFEYPVDGSTGLSNPFSDVDVNTPEGKAAIYLYHKSIIGGYEDGTFRPENYVNRAEISKFIANVLFKGQVKSYTAADNKGLSDLFVSDWFYNFVVAMLQNGIFDGYPDKSFKPGNYINAAELAKVLSNAFELDVVVDVSEYSKYMKDINGTEWYAPFAYYTVVKHKLFPKRETFFNGGTNVTRGELAYAVHKIMIDQGL